MIETDRLVLRPPEDRDVDAVHRFVVDPEVMRWIGRDGKVETYEGAVERIARYKRAWEADGFGLFMVMLKASGQVVGRVGLLVWDPATWRNGTRAELGETAELELGWTLERAAWGHGFATEAAIAISDWAFREVEPPRLISLIHPDNVRSLRVAQKLGEHYVQDVALQGDTAQLWALPSPP